MSEYIDREAFLKDAETRYCLPCKVAGKDSNGVKCRACWVDDMMGEVEDAPAADVALVVRCRACRHYRNPPNGMCTLHTEPCENAAGYKGEVVCVEADDFCSYGERKLKGEKT